MSHIPHDGLRLPLFSENEVALDADELYDQLKQAWRSQQSHILRYARLNPHTQLGLTETLHIADSLFLLVADMCGTDVVEHEWGLAPIPEHLPPSPQTGELSHAHRALPAGMLLVAKVAVLARPPAPEDVFGYAQTTTAIYDQLETDLERFSTAAAAKLGAQWADISIHQFMLHVPPGSAAEAGRLALVDIEPNIIVQNTNRGI